MHRIDGPGTVENFPIAHESGTLSGFFDGGNPATGRMSTVVTSDWCNSVQEEIVSVILEGGEELDKNNNKQLLFAIQLFIERLMPDGDLKPLQVCDIDFFNRKTPPNGYVVANGALLANADALYPKLWAFLQKSENAWLLRTESQWQALIHPDGVGGANAFVLDADAKTLRLPDIRGDYMAGAGWNGKVPGDSDGDAARILKGYAGYGYYWYPHPPTAPFEFTAVAKNGFPLEKVVDDHDMIAIYLNSALSTPTDTRNHPATIYQLPCVYVGVPTVIS